MTKKMTIAATLLVLSAGQYCAFGTDNPIQEDLNATAIYPSLGAVAKYNKIEIVTLAAMNEDTDPRSLRLVCREWRNIIDELNSKKDKEPIYVDLHPIWQKIVRVNYGGLGHDGFYEQFLNGRLIYKQPTGEEVVLRFLDFRNPFQETFDLSQCGDKPKYLRITTSVKDFFEVGRKNKYKVVILIALRQLVKQEIESSAKPFERLMAKWDLSKAPVGIFWRWGNDANSSTFDYLTDSSLSVLSSKNLYENWEQAQTRAARNVEVSVRWQPAGYAILRTTFDFMFVL